MEKCLPGWRNVRPQLIWILSAALLFGSCAKQATQYRTIDQAKAAPVLPENTQDQAGTATLKVEPGSALAIDTSAYDLATRLAFLVIKQGYYNQKVRDKVGDFYAQTNYQTRWLHQHAPNDLYYSFTNMVRNSGRYGMNPDEYVLQQLEDRVAALYKAKPVSLTEIYNLDIQLTGIFFLFTTHVIDGRILETGYGKDIWIRESSGKDKLDVSLLAKSCATGSCEETLQSIHPNHEQYVKLQNALAQYRDLEKKSPAASTIVAAESIKPGMNSPALPAIRRRLAYTDLVLSLATHDSITSVVTDSTYYDDVLVSAVKWFQYRHGLEADGVIGKGTLKFLNQSFREKADLIALNLERLRWERERVAEKLIVVNVPEYKMRLYDNNKETMSMRVIVGAQATSTPVFSDTLRYLVFSPTWNVPLSIIKNEIIPHLVKNPEYYTNKNYRFYKSGAEIDPALEDWTTANPNRYTVIQLPGGDNALGRVKFVMPNNMSIYMHDTPNHRPFTKSYRAMSHGCVRLDEPLRLAEYLLQNQYGWTGERVKNAMMGEQPMTIILKKPYRIQLEYRTVWIDEAGLVNFREDIYGHDRRQMDRLQTSSKAGVVINGAVAMEMP